MLNLQVLINKTKRGWLSSSQQEIHNVIDATLSREGLAKVRPFKQKRLMHSQKILSKKQAKCWLRPLSYLIILILSFDLIVGKFLQVL